MANASYAPVKMEHAELWAVPVVLQGTKGEDEYHVYVGDNMTRIFSVKTLPDTIKEKLAMVHAFISDREPEFSIVYPWEIRPPSFYPDDFKNIGWFVAKNTYSKVYLYNVVLPFDELCDIRGEKAA